MLPALDPALLALPVGCTPAVAWSVAAVNAGLYAVDYGVLFDGSSTFFQYWISLDRGAALHGAGVALTDLSNSLQLLLAASEGNHFLYYLYNASAVAWYGYGYHAPLALNVLVGVAWLARSCSWPRGSAPGRRRRRCSPACLCNPTSPPVRR